MKRIRRLLPYLRRYPRAFVLGLTLVLVATICGLAIPRLMKQVIDLISRHGTIESVRLYAGGILGLALLRGGLLFVGRYGILSAARKIEYEIRNDLYSHLSRLSSRYFDTTSTGDLTSRAINDLEGVRMMVGIGVMSIVSTGFLCAGAVVSMFLKNPALAAVCMVPLGLVSVVMAWTGSRMHDLSMAVQEQLSLLSSRAQENFTGARVVRAFVQEEKEAERFRVACDEYRRRNLRLTRWRTFQWSMVLLLTNATIALTLWVGGRFMIAGTLTRGDFAEFAAYEFMLVWPMIAIGWIINVFQRGIVCQERLDQVFDVRPENDDARAIPAAVPIAGAVELRNLSFSYSPDRRPALQDVSLRIEPGQKVAIVGRTGAGKSTLLQLLLRLYRVPDGALFVDGRDVNTIPLAELRGAIGAVPQDLFLFSEKIRENVAFGGRNGVGEEDLLRAVEISRLAADLPQFPEGLDQVIGERGVTLSGGQKQRTALARALVRGPRILVLDDALSSVDAHTEREIQDRLRPFMAGRTSIVITHRLSAIVDADRIFVLEDGRLAEQGRHPELLAANGSYAALWESQALEEELADA